MRSVSDPVLVAVMVDHVSIAAPSVMLGCIGVATRLRMWSARRRSSSTAWSGVAARARRRCRCRWWSHSHALACQRPLVVLVMEMLPRVPGCCCGRGMASCGVRVVRCS